MKKRITVIALALSMLFSSYVPIKAAERYTYYENFNKYVTNKAHPVLNATEGCNIRIADLGGSNKALMLPTCDNDSEIEIPFVNAPDRFVASFDLQTNGEPVNAELFFVDTHEGINEKYLSIKGNTAVLNNGKRLGTLSTVKQATVSIAVNRTISRYSVFFNNNEVVTNKAFSSEPGNDGFIRIKKIGGRETGNMYVDNVRIYNGIRPNVYRNTDTSGYNPERIDYISINNDSGDFAFMNNKYINDVNNTYTQIAGTNMSFISAPKDNRITYNRYDRFNPKRENDIIKMEKITSSDCYFDTECKLKYRYVYLGGSFMFEKTGAYVDLFYLRDSYTNGSNVNVEKCRVSPTGDIQIMGKTIDKVSLGKWFRVELAVDTVEHTMSAFYNGKLVVDKAVIDSNLNWISVVRTNIAASGGPTTLYVDDYEITGMKKPYTGSDNDKSSVFSDDSGYIDYLKDKIAFHTFADNVTLNGTEKYYSEIPSYYDKARSEYFIAAPTFSKAFGIDLSEEPDAATVRIEPEKKSVIFSGKEYTLDIAPESRNGHTYIPVKSFAENVLNYYTADDGNGMILLSKEPILLDFESDVPEYMRPDSGWEQRTDVPESEVKGLNFYLCYRRPQKQELKEKFFAEAKEGPAHPRIIARQADFDRIRTRIQSDDVMKQWYESTLKAADGLVDYGTVQYSMPDKRRLLEQSRALLKYSEYLGFAYKMTGDAKYKEALWKNIDAAANFPDWNTSHMIDTGEMLMGFAIAYDWLYDAWTPEQRSVMETAMMEKGLEHVWRGYYGWLCGGRMIQASLFPKSKTNFNVVINGGALSAALAIADVYPEKCFDIVQNSIRSVEYTIRCFQEEGTWLEGGAYWDYTVSYLSKLVGSLNSVYGTDFGLMDNPRIKNSGIFIASMIGNAGINNYHDTEPNANVQTSRLTWYAKVTDNPALFTLRRDAIEAKKTTPDVYDLLYWPENSDAGYDGLALDYYASGLESFSMRSSWEDKEGMYVSAHAGPVNYYHSQADVGTFVFDSMGERWASDLGLENYSFINNGGYSFEKIYRRRAESHNVVVFNSGMDLEQDWDGFAPLTDFVTKPKGGYAVYDMSDIYKKDVSKYNRGFYIGDDRQSLTVRDEIKLKKSGTMYWFMETEANVFVNADGKGAVLTKNGKTLRLDYAVEGSDDYSLEVMDSVPLPTSPQLAGQTVNADYKRIAIKINGREDVSITVRLSPFGGEIKTIPIAEWTVPDGEPKEFKLPAIEEYIVDGESYSSLSQIVLTDDAPAPQITVKGENGTRADVQYVDSDSSERYEITVYAEDGRSALYILTVKRIRTPQDVMGYSRYPAADIFASSEPEPMNNKWNICDESFDTRWTTFYVGEYGIIDLGKSVPVDAIALSFWKGDERRYSYSLYYSIDGENYEPVVSNTSGGTTEEFELNTFPRINARYIKYVSSGNTINTNSNITELAVLKNKDQ